MHTCRAFYSYLKLKTKVYDVKTHNPLASDRVQVRVYTNTLSHTHTVLNLPAWVYGVERADNNMHELVNTERKKGMEERAKEMENLLSCATI